jgi:hypothetical protein
MNENSYEEQQWEQRRMPALKTPDFWLAAQQKIIGMQPEQPTFVSYQSVIEDPETHELAIDRKDWVIDTSRLDFANDFPSIGVMRIISGQVDGYIADLRYTRRMEQRRLYFDDPLEDNTHNKKLLTQPLFGAIFVDWIEGSETFLCQEEDGYVGEDILVTLKRFVDEERTKRGLDIFGDATQATHVDEAGVNDAANNPKVSGQILKPGLHTQDD